MKRTKPGVFRVLPLLLALLIVVNLPISAFAAEATQESDISLLATTDVPDEMLDSYILKALLYLGYDSDGYLRNNGYLYQTSYISSKLKSNYPDALTGIPYANGGGTATTTSGGKTVPNVASFKTNGMVCTSFIEYYYLNYLRYIAGASDGEMLTLATTIQSAYTKAYQLYLQNPSAYPDLWSTTGDLLTTAAYNSIARKSTLEARYSGSYTTAEYQAFFDNLSIGSLIQFGGDDYSNYTNDYIHYAVYAGSYNGEYYIIHVGNSRGPEISLARYMEQDSSKKSWPIAAYDFSPWEEYGSIEIYKDNPDGKPLAGATFRIVYPDGSREYITTDSTGYASLDELPLGKYTIQETIAPDGYELDDTVYTVTLTTDDPTGGGTIHVTNTPITGSLSIYKDSKDGTPLAGAMFLVEHPDGNHDYITTDSSGCAFLDELPLGTYTITEVTAPTGYEKVDTVWTVTLSEDDPTGGGTIHVTNTPKTGSLKIFKDILPSSAATSGNLAGWQFNIYTNSSSYTTTIRSGVKYRVKMTNADTGDVLYSDTASLTVQSNPAIKILSHPQSDAVSDGDTITFNVAATSTTGKTLTYRWYYQTVENPGTWTATSASTGSSTSYSITMAERLSGRSVKCLISDGTNQVWSNVAYLYVDTLLDDFAIVDNLDGASGAKGDTVTLHASAQGTGVIYEWQISTDGGSTWAAANEDLSGVYYTTIRDGVIYRVKVTDVNGNSVYSDTAELTVEENTTVTITAQPQSSAVAIGDLISFTVNAETTDGGEPSYFWYYRKVGEDTWNLTSASTGRSATYSTTLWSSMVGRSVKCLVQYGDYEVWTSEAYLYEASDDFTIVDNLDSISGVEGDTVKLHVSAQGTGVTYEWEYSTDGGNTWTAANRLITTVTTDATGTVQIDNLPAGSYYVQEIDTGVVGWEYDLTPKVVTVTANATATITFTNELTRGSITVTKKVIPEGSGGRVNDWIIELYAVNADGSTTLLTTGTTGTDGVCSFADLEKGLYIVKESETNACDGYLLDSQIYEVEVFDGIDTPVTIVNTHVGTGTIFKNVLPSSTATAEVLAGWQFNIYQSSPSYAATIRDGVLYRVKITDASGDSIYSDSGELTLADSDAEIQITSQPKSGVVSNGEKLSFHVEAESTTGATLSYRWYYQLVGSTTWTATSINTGSTDTYSVDLNADRHGRKVKCLISDGTNEVWSNEAYLYLDTLLDSFCIIDNLDGASGAAGDEVVLSVHAQGTDLIYQWETSTDGGDTWTIVYGNLHSTVTSETDGAVQLSSIPVGYYFVEEIGHMSFTVEELSYWLLDTEVKLLQIQSEQANSISFTNQWFGKASIHKTVTNSETVEGWLFEVKDSLGEVLQGSPFQSDASGNIDLGLIAPGTYYVKEVGHETYDLSYWIMDTEVKELTIEAGKTSSVSFQNVWMGCLVIDKSVVNSDLLAGWTGDLYFVNADGSETKIGTYTSDANGRFANLLVAPGEYIFRETGHSDSDLDLTYWVMASDADFHITAGATITATITNIKFGCGQIFKDTTNGGTKEGWLFEVRDGYGNELDGSPFATNADGIINLGLLLPGSYTVQEIGHTDMSADQLLYWTQDTAVKPLVIEAGATTQAKVENQWLGIGQIEKKMPDGGSVAGWVFDVYRTSDNTHVGTFTTDADGLITTGYLIPGDYRIIEQIPDDSLYLPVGGNEKVLTVVAGEIKSVTFNNVLRSGEFIVNKVDGSTDAALAGAKFLLEWLDNDIWKPVIFSDTIIPGGCQSDGLENGCLVTGEDGRIVFEGLHPDYQYRVTEVEAPNGYSLQSAPVFQGRLPSDTLTAEVEVLNYGTIVLPSTGVESYLTGLTVFASFVICLFFVMVAFAAKQGLLTEKIRCNKKQFEKE